MYYAQNYVIFKGVWDLSPSKCVVCFFKMQLKLMKKGLRYVWKKQSRLLKNITESPLNVDKAQRTSKQPAWGHLTQLQRVHLG